MRAAGLYLPQRPNGHRAVAFLSVCDRDKPAATLLAQRLADLGFDLVATPGTARRIAQLGIEVTEVAKVGADDGNSVVDLVRSGKVDLIVNTPVGRGARTDGYQIRRAAISAQGALHHDARRRQRGGAGDRARLAGRAQEPAGAARLTPSRVAACEPLGPYVQVRLERTFDAGEPGQFHMLRALAHDSFLARPLSAVASDDAGVTFLCQPRGPALAALAQVGAEVEVLGPFGRGFDPAAAGCRAPARRRRVRRRAAGAALAPPARGRAARRLPRRRRGACRRARAGGRARDRAPARQRARPAGARGSPGAPASSPPGPTASCAPSPRPARRRGCRARSRSRRRWPAATAPATAAPCASAASSCGSASRAPSWRASAWRRRERRSRHARRGARARASGDERVRHARSAGRARRRARDRRASSRSSSPRP